MATDLTLLENRGSLFIPERLFEFDISVYNWLATQLPVISSWLQIVYACLMATIFTLVAIQNRAVRS